MLMVQILCNLLLTCRVTGFLRINLTNYMYMYLSIQNDIVFFEHRMMYQILPKQRKN